MPNSPQVQISPALQTCEINNDPNPAEDDDDITNTDVISDRLIYIYILNTPSSEIKVIIALQIKKT